jgi:hypothetical protein
MDVSDDRIVRADLSRRDVVRLGGGGLAALLLASQARPG